MILTDKYPLGFFPTPIEKLERLSERFAPTQFWIKRDDQSGLATGGNKVRKLEFLIREALNQQCDTIITAGAQQSNHCRQTAAACAKAGLQCHLLLGGNRPDAYNGNLLLSHMLGAIIHFTGDKRKGEDIDQLYQRLEAENRQPYVIPYGGSNKIGAIGFASAILELQKQLEELDVQPDYIFFASSSGGTHAGMMLGQLLTGLKAEIVGINIDKNETYEVPLEEEIARLVQEGKKLLEIRPNINSGPIRLLRKYDAPGYGVVTEQEREAIHLLAHLEGILLDPVYTARAFYGMIDQVRTKQIDPSSQILFWHTGGIPANFQYASDLI
jgi:D-cysteine desulfhydrase family pyridoxal phosphate-dependent enzyme